MDRYLRRWSFTFYLEASQPARGATHGLLLPRVLLLCTCTCTGVPVNSTQARVCRQREWAKSNITASTCIFPHRPTTARKCGERELCKLLQLASISARVNLHELACGDFTILFATAAYCITTAFQLGHHAAATHYRRSARTILTTCILLALAISRHLYYGTQLPIPHTARYWINLADDFQ